MPAEHEENRPGEPVPDGTTPPGDPGALMAAVAGEPPDRAALADEAFAEAYRAAAADVAVLREQLGLIGAALAGAPPGAAPHPPAAAVTPLPARRPRPSPRGLALRGLVAAAGAAVVLGGGWLVVHGDGTGAQADRGASSAADAAAGQGKSAEDHKTGLAGYLACARLLAEGTVAGTEAVPGTGRVRVTLDVTRRWKPGKGRDRVVFPLDGDARPRPKAGDHVLVGIPQGQDEPDLWTTGEEEIARDRARLTAALPEARTLPCP
ncbi:hypothetical protein [Streptomyces sp. NPDC057382]|uniref:hypothetical protein n=1 Tax=unclassified Streptomyces TaxID=2593676 RepID=UPI003644707A